MCGGTAMANLTYINDLHALVWWSWSSAVWYHAVWYKYQTNTQVPVLVLDHEPYFPMRLTHLPRKWGNKLPPKWWYPPTKLHSITSQMHDTSGP
jgi:hypothetical protein